MKIPPLGSVLEYIKKAITNPVVRNVMIVGGVTLLIKVIAFYKETLVASTFGLSLLLDTFIIAILIPGFIQNVFIGSLNNIFIPNYITEQNTTKQLGQFQGVIFYSAAGIMLFFTLLLYLASDVFVEFVFPGKDQKYYDLIRKQLIIILPALIFMGFSMVIGGLLQIKDKFLSSTLIGIIPPLSTIITLLFFKEALGERVLAVGFSIGAIIPFFFLWYLGVKHDVLIIKKPKLNANSRLMIKQLPAKITSGFLSGINPIVDQYFAAQLVIGSLASISYGQKIPAFTSSIILIALGTVVLPYFSKLINEDLLKGYHHLYRMTKILFFGAIIVILPLLFFSEEIVFLLFERGKFTEENTRVVGTIQQILLIYIPFRLCGILMVKFLTSINKNNFMAYVGIIKLILNIILNIILIKKYGLYGLALSTTFVTVLTAISFYMYTRYLYAQVKSSR